MLIIMMTIAVQIITIETGWAKFNVNPSPVLLGKNILLSIGL